MSSKFCGKCGAAMARPEDRFCTGCGAPQEPRSGGRGRLTAPLALLLVLGVGLLFLGVGAVTAAWLRGLADKPKGTPVASTQRLQGRGDEGSEAFDQREPEDSREAAGNHSNGAPSTGISDSPEGVLGHERTPSGDNAHLASCEFRLRSIASALEIYHTDEGFYPGALNAGFFQQMGWTEEPTCPSSNTAYTYGPTADLHDFVLSCDGGIHSVVLGGSVDPGYPQYAPAVGLLRKPLP